MFKAKLTKDTGESVTITLPQDYSRLSEAVASSGTRLWPEHISMDGNGERVRGELIPDNEMGEHLNSVTSVTHFWFGFSAWKSLFRRFGTIFPVSPL